MCYDVAWLYEWRLALEEDAAFSFKAVSKDWIMIHGNIENIGSLCNVVSETVYNIEIERWYGGCSIHPFQSQESDMYCTSRL